MTVCKGLATRNLCYNCKLARLLRGLARVATMLGSCTKVMYKVFLDFLDCLIVPLDLCMCATFRDYMCPMYEIISFNITMLHFVLFHNVICYTNSLLSCVHVNIIKLYNIMCTLVATIILYCHASMLTL